MKPTVAVLMSTYNGERFLKEQLDSILSQVDVEVHLVVRDDGSKDHTLAILNEYVDKFANITILEEDNCGCEASFEKLNRYAHENIETNFYAYADQDDVWYPEKLHKSILAIENEKQPALFCCNQMITDEDLKPLHLMLDDYNYDRICEVQRINYFKNRHGCTMVWNRALMNILGSAKHNSAYIPIHDKWITMLARCSGKVLLGKEPLQYYRIHIGNASGYATGFFSRIKKGIRLYWMKDSLNSLYADDIIRYLSQNTTKNSGIHFVMLVRGYKRSLFTRLRVALSPQIWNEGVAEGCIHSISILVGKY